MPITLDMPATNDAHDVAAKVAEHGDDGTKGAQNNKLPNSYCVKLPFLRSSVDAGRTDCRMDSDKVSRHRCRPG